MHVPVWHEKLKTARDSGRIRMLGIVQEQHGERARLFKQWKGLDWPILYDPFGHLEVTYVPIMVGIDASGIIRKLWPAGMGADQVATEFIAAEFANEQAQARPPAVDAEARTLWAEAGPARLDELIDTYRDLATQRDDDGFMHFRLGVAYRMRHDGPSRAPGDFQAAVRAWTRALEIDPNNYIWRRRLQQYGPRAAKPYPFYDWVSQARDAIRARGDSPVALAVEPGDSELAQPGRPTAQPDVSRDADADGRIHRDGGELIQVETTCVPARVQPGDAVRLYVALRPRRGSQAHWNNEVDDLEVWLQPPAAWSVTRRAHAFPNPKQALSREERVVEIDVVVPKGTAAGRVTLPAYALYYVCEDVRGVCLYRRQDVALQVDVGEATPLAGR